MSAAWTGIASLIDQRIREYTIMKVLVRDFEDDVLPALANPPSVLPNERRRPGRIENISPILIPLIRHPALDMDRCSGKDNLRSPRGILAGACMSLLLWAFLFTIVWLIISK